MAQSPSSDDHFDPNDRMPAVRARVPDHVAIGQISTGVIVVTGATEYILDFVRNLPRPNMIVARVVLPHGVMPQFIEALNTNINLFRQRFGELPATPSFPPQNMPQDKPVPQFAASAGGSAGDSTGSQGRSAGSSNLGNSDSNAGADASMNPNQPTDPATNDANKAPSSGFNPPPSTVNRHTSPHEVYDDLKLRDELLSGAYANAVMIGHGPHEFCFDFITNFYPQSAVSCRVFMAAGHVGRLLDSLRASWDQLRPRLGGM